MRLFKRYTPSMVAKHVTRLFKGCIYIDGIGKLDFDQGKVMLPPEAQIKHFKAVKEINQEISKLRTLQYA